MESTKKTTYAEIKLPYFKQGDDLHDCISKNEDGKVDAKKTLENHIGLLECTIKQLKDINEKIPLVNDIVLKGDTHWITISGDERIINTLVEQELAFKFSDDENSDDENSDEHSDENSDDKDDDNDSSADVSIEESQI